MKAGPPIRTHGGQIEGKTLRKNNPEAARKAALLYLKTNQRNAGESSRLFGIGRSVVYDILRKKAKGDLHFLADLSTH